MNSTFYMINMIYRKSGFTFSAKFEPHLRYRSLTKSTPYFVHMHDCLHVYMRSH